MSVLDQRAINRAVLARQHLLERIPATVPEALGRLGGLQAQYAPSPYVGLWSRTEGFARDDLTRALEAREAVQGTLMRVTIHVVARGDYWPFALATRDARRALWLRTRRGTVTRAEHEAAADAVRAVATPLTRKDLEALVGRDMIAGVGQWIDLVRVPPSGTWERRRADLFARAEDWIGPPDTTAEAGLEHLVHSYLRAFGPASRKDVASYTGVPLTALRPVLEGLDHHRSESGEVLLDVPGAPLPDSDTPAPARFVGPWDAVLLVHARRAGIVPEEHRPKIFTSSNPHSTGVYLVDGRVAGAWRPQDGRIELQPYDGNRPSAEVREEAARLAELFG